MCQEDRDIAFPFRFQLCRKTIDRAVVEPDLITRSGEPVVHDIRRILSRESDHADPHSQLFPFRIHRGLVEDHIVAGKGYLLPVVIQIGHYDRDAVD